MHQSSVDQSTNGSALMTKSGGPASMLGKNIVEEAVASRDKRK